ncbi:MAG TPA: hypothetical protein EYN97_01405 [Candidatus Lambdaproteobacteria bacterium]|nr:hypothetical protein [Candidatus Lambdaproteobacteria bacterium]
MFNLPTIQISRIIRGVLARVFAVLLFLGLSGTLFAQSSDDKIKIVMPTDARVIRVDAKIDQWVYAGDTLAVLKDSKGAKFKFRAGISGQLVFWRLRNLKHYGAGETVGILRRVVRRSLPCRLLMKCCSTFTILPDLPHCFVDRVWIGRKGLAA